MCLYLRAKFLISSITLRSFRQGGRDFTRPAPQNEPLKGPPKLVLRLTTIYSSTAECTSFQIDNIKKKF